MAVVAVGWAVLPIIVLVVIAMTSPADNGTTDPSYLGISPDVASLFGDPQWPYLRWYLNSLLAAGTGAALVTILGVAAVYGLSVRGVRSGAVGSMTLLLQAFPPILAVLGIYLTVAKVGTAIPQVGPNSWLALALVYVGAGLSWVVWHLSRRLAAVPGEIVDAARLDGAGHVRIFVTFTLRHLAPALGTVFGVVFVVLFGEFLLASVLLREPDRLTLAVGLAQAAGDDVGLTARVAAGALVACLPGLLVLAVGIRRRAGTA